MPVSGKYIEDVSGLSFIKFTQIADSDDVTAKKLVQRCIDSGIEKAFENFTRILSEQKRYSLATWLTAFELGKYDVGSNPTAPTYTFIPANGQERGVRIIRKTNSNRLSKISINEIKIVANPAVQTATTIKIVDTQNNEITTYPVTLDPSPTQPVIVPINKTFQGNEIYIVLTDTTIPVASALIYEKNYSGGGGCGGGCGGGGVSKTTAKNTNTYIDIQGINGSQIDTNQLYGFVFDQTTKPSLICDKWELFCQLKQYCSSNVTTMVLEFIAIEVLNEALLGTDRFNYITIDRENLLNNIKHHQKESEYAINDLLTASQQVLTTLDSLCIKCNNLKLSLLLVN
jgi:hypothetical protein